MKSPFMSISDLDRAAPRPLVFSGIRIARFAKPMGRGGLKFSLRVIQQAGLGGRSVAQLGFLTENTYLRRFFNAESILVFSFHYGSHCRYLRVLQCQ